MLSGAPMQKVSRSSGVMSVSSVSTPALSNRYSFVTNGEKAAVSSRSRFTMYIVVAELRVSRGNLRSGRLPAHLPVVSRPSSWPKL